MRNPSCRTQRRGVLVIRGQQLHLQTPSPSTADRSPSTGPWTQCPMRRRSVRAACSRACCAEWSSRCCCRPGSSCCPRPWGGTRPALRSAARPAPLGALVDASARPLVRAERACGESVVCPAHRRRAVPHLRPRGKRVGRSGLFCRAKPPASARFGKLLETFYGPRTAPCPRKQKIFEKTGIFSKNIFHRRKNRLQ